MNTCQTNNETWPQPYGAWNSYGNGGGFVSYAHLVTPKEVWAGPSPEHAFSEDIPWTYKRQSKMKYFEMLEEERRTLCRVVRFEPGKNHKWTVEPQISAFFMQFPWPARASVGHTVFLEAAHESDKTLPVNGNAVWIDRHGDRSLVQVVREAAFDAPDFFGWVACDTRTTREVAQVLKDHYGIPRRAMKAQAYWMA